MVQCNLSTFRAWLNYTGRWLGNKMWGFALKYHIQASWVFSQWANQSETACLPNSLHLFFCQLIQCTSALWQSFSGTALWASYFVLNPPCNIHTCALSLIQRENPPAWQSILPFSCLLLILRLFAFPPTSLTVSHTFPCFWNTGMFPLAVLFDNMGHWCCSHVTHKHQSMCVLTDLLFDIDKACPEVQHKHLCQIQIRHRHTRAHGWTDGRVIGAGLGLCSQDADLPHNRKQFVSLPTHR